MGTDVYFAIGIAHCAVFFVWVKMAWERRQESAACVALLVLLLAWPLVWIWGLIDLAHVFKRSIK